MEGSRGILRYGKDELLSIWDAHGDAREEWREDLMAELGPELAEELRELESVPDGGRFRRRNKNSERRLRSKAKRDALHALSTNELALNEDNEDFLDDSCGLGGLSLDEKACGREFVAKVPRKSRVRYDEDESEVESFQPPAFAVDGEPDFESGPPQDGWEYLRRVKHEAALCPKVVVAEIDPKKLTSAQTQYMPEVPAIPVCSQELLPSEAWEKQLLADFSMLRVALSNTRVPRKVGSASIPSLRNRAAWEACCFGSVAGKQLEETTEPDSATGERRATDSKSGIEPERASIPSGDPPRSRNGNSLTGESAAESVDADKDPVALFNDLLEKQLDQLLNAVSVDQSYVIDLSLLSAKTGVETEESFETADYLISGDPVDDDHGAQDKGSADASGGVHESDSEDDSAIRAGARDSHDIEVGGSGCPRDCAVGIENQFEQLTVGEEEDVVDVRETRRQSFSRMETAKCEGDQPITAEFMDSLAGQTEFSNQEDLIYGTDTQFEFADTGNPEILESDMEVMLPSSYADFPEFEDVQMPNSDLADSAIGLEIYRSSNILEDDGGDSASVGDDFEIDQAVDDLFAKVSHLAGLSRLPFMHLLVRLDEISRATLLRHHVSWLEHVDGLPQDRAVWLMALAAAVDAPVDAQTSAAFRVLLRHCAGVRASMREGGDEGLLHRLNVLITVAGLYFGQGEAVRSVQS